MNLTLMDDSLHSFMPNIGNSFERCTRCVSLWNRNEIYLTHPWRLHLSGNIIMQKENKMNVAKDEKNMFISMNWDSYTT